MNTSNIDSLITTLRKILTVIVKFDASADKRESVRTALRKLLTIRELHSTYFIAVTGVQGVGKTNIIREMYGLHEWLTDNPGRGERRPLFIVETDCETPSAVGVDDQGKEHTIDPQTLQEALRNFSSGDAYLLLRLYVPKKYLGNNLGFLLLPGYEILNRTNKLWQEEMKDALKHSLGSILVTNASTMANSTSQRVLDDLVNNVMCGRNPIIAISHTESQEEHENLEIKKTAAETFKVSKDELDKIICTGRGAKGRDAWVSELVKAINSYMDTPEEIYFNRLNELSSLLDDDFDNCASSLEELLVESDIKETSQEILINRILKTFRDSADKYRINYSKKLREHSNVYIANAIKNASSKYIETEEGWGNKIRSIGNYISLDFSKNDDNYTSLIKNSWVGQDTNNPLNITYLALTDMASDKFSISKIKNNELNQTDLDERLGYKGEGGINSLFKVEIDADRLNKNIRHLLRSADAENNDIMINQGEIKLALEFMPTLAMEYMRISQGVMLTKLQDSEVSLNDLEKYSPEKLGEQIANSLPGVAKTTQEVMKTVLAIGAVDFAIDGSFDIATVMAGGSVSGLGATLSIAAAGAIVFAFIGYKTIESINQFDSRKKSFIAMAIKSFADNHIEKNLSYYDEIIDRLENQLKNNLYIAYGVDKEKFSERDSLARVLFDFKKTRHDLKKEVEYACSGRLG